MTDLLTEEQKEEEIRFQLLSSVPVGDGDRGDDDAAPRFWSGSGL